MLSLAASERVMVAGIGDMVISDDPDGVLTAYGLGSCVALTAWDPFKKVAGLAHFMLPSDRPVDLRSPVKFIGGGFEHFLSTYSRAGGITSRSRFKVVGGAATLSISSGLEIGRRNAESVLAALASARLPVAATEVGGNAGRTVQLQVRTGRLLVWSVSTSHEL
jgi:chemotaxis protein CheD